MFEENDIQIPKKPDGFNEKMSIGQIAKAAGLHHTSIYRKAINLYPDRFKNGVKTLFNWEESYKILGAVGKKNFVVPLDEVAFKGLGKKRSLRNAKQPIQNAKVEELLGILQKTNPNSPIFIINL